MNNLKHVSHPPLVYNNSAMDMAILVQMRQCRKCESVCNDAIAIISLHLGSGAEDPSVSTPPPCLLQDTRYIY